ncbi:MAG: CotH kinase family protein [Defluviitaleaceae bacterium]|nr:CotH kinase family protein [Defluviitaleaceae bacterium]
MLKKILLGSLVLLFLCGAGFPAIRITVPESPFVERNIWQDGVLGVVGAVEEQSFSAVDTRIRGRGNSTWWNGEDKRPLRFRFGEARSMFGSEYEARDWILLANHFDGSLLRNYAALYLSREMGRMHAVQTFQNVHLYVNGDYMGVYLLTDERDVARLEIEFDEDPAISGFFIELDHRAPDSGVENETFVMVNDLPYDIRFPGSSRLSDDHVEYLKGFLARVCLAIRTHDFDEVSRLIDIDSFVDYYLVQELFKNSDGPLSNFMYIDGVGNERRLFMGPAWDFDISAGVNSRLPLGRHDDQVIIMGMFSLWYRNLLKIPEFNSAVVTRWNEIYDAQIPQMMERIEHLAVNYRAEFERNFIRHPFVYPTDSFVGQVAFLQSWMNERVNWLDDYFNGRNPDFDPIGALVEFHTNESPIQIELNGEPLSFEISPIILHGRTMIPASELPFDVMVERADDTIIISNGYTTVTTTLYSPFFFVNDVEHDFIVSSVSAGGEIFLPLRQIAEIFGYDVYWNGSAITIAQIHTKSP